MTVRIEGLISRRTIKGWLENWDSTKTGDRPFDGIPTSSGYKVKDGISSSTINKMMLGAALKDMPPVLLICVKYRWIDQWPLKKVLDQTGLSKSTYYRRCDKVIDFIYYHVNGEAANIKDLLEAIQKY